ncbi:MAG: HEAT repeat domain-containing protein [bacterium]
MKPKAHLGKLIPLYLYGELSEVDRKEFEVHIEYCERCREKLAEMRALHALLNQKARLEPGEDLLNQSRMKLRERLRQERKVLLRESVWERISEFFASRNLAIQLGGTLAILVIGLLIGRFVLVPRASVQMANSTPLSSQTQQAFNRPLIADVDLIQYDPKTGEVTVRYKSINDVALRGNINDAAVQRILAHSIRSETNAGHRLMAVKAFGGSSTANDEIEEALIYAMEQDTVDGVRLRAAKVLKKLPINDRIKRAFIKVLLKDANTAIRIEAIEALSQEKQNEDVIPVLRGAAKDDDNEFIRLKASELLQALPDSVLDENNGEDQ